MSLGSILKGALGIGAGLIPGVGPVLSGILGAGGAAAGAMSHGAAQNRDAQFSGQMDLGTLLAQRDLAMQNLRAGADNDYTANQIARERSGMETRDDAWRKLLSAQHTSNPSAAPQLAGKYNIAPRQASNEERVGADAMTQEVMARLQGGNAVAPIEKRNPAFDYDPMSTIDPKLLKPGKAEKIGGILGPILSGIGGLGGNRNAGVPGPPRMGTPGGPMLSPGDLAWLRSQSPALA